jgi:hypothetical protein
MGEHRLYFDSGNVYVDGEKYQKLNCVKLHYDITVEADDGSRINLIPIGDKDHLLLFITDNSYNALQSFK